MASKGKQVRPGRTTPEQQRQLGPKKSALEPGILDIVKENPVGAVGWAAVTAGCGITIPAPATGLLTIGAGLGLCGIQMYKNKQKRDKEIHS